ncbi:MAG: glycosyltransferase family 4 protein, partial [Acidobacteria bacterium]|nr:glycosyltransferase family 4 protein [Acidobacteriota bacterium]
AIATQSRDRVGGVETYLEAVLPPLARRHAVAFCSASDVITERGAIALPPGVPALTIDRSARDPLHQLRAWRPDLLFAHGLDDPALEIELLALAPAVVVQHTYHGTCISSSKTMTWPEVKGCERAFGAACLALYFPRRCGGSNPITMARLYRSQTLRLAGLKRAAAVVTLSAHMKTEMLRNGVRRDRLHVIPPFVSRHEEAGRADRTDGPGTLLYLGRLERLKGVDRLFDALRLVAARAGRPVHLIVAGDGSERLSLQAHARSIRESDPRIVIDFVGWQDEAGRTKLLAGTDALVVPSLWPEPFGLVGLEAAAAGVPSIAFATGGIPEWLRDGENGCLAPSAGGRPDLLAAAIVRCIGVPETLARLRTGAFRGAAAWTMQRHLARLEHVFDLARGEAKPVRVENAMTASRAS